MLSAEQQRQMDTNILKAVEDFLINGGTMEEVASRTQLTSSSVQRYLNNRRIIYLLDEDVFNQVQEKLKLNKKQACSKGGYISTKNNVGIRSEDGKFVGNKKR